MQNQITSVILMGVSGTGKTTIGKQLSKKLDWQYIEGDDYHSKENIAKMSRGIALNDEDRSPWLQRLNEEIWEHQRRGESTVCSCSALKRDYRDLITRGLPNSQLVYLLGHFDLIHERLSQRDDHYMKADLLRSQFAILEEPDENEALIISVEKSIDEILSMIMHSLKLV